MNSILGARRAPGAVLVALLTATMLATPASAGNPARPASGTVVASGGQRTGADAGTSRADRVPARVGRSRAAFERAAAREHGDKVRGAVTNAAGIAATQPGPALRTSVSPAAADPLPGMSTTTYLLNAWSGWFGSTTAASPTRVLRSTGDYLQTYARDQVHWEATSIGVADLLGLPAAEAAGDASVTWDRRHGRWVLAATSWEYDEATCDQGYLELAVSAGEDPAGTWTSWRIPIGARSAENLSLGVSDSLIAISGNEFPLDGRWVSCLSLPFSGARVRAMDWADVLDGGTLTVRDLTPAAPRHAWSYRLAQDVSVGDDPDAGDVVSLLVDRYDAATDGWGNVVYGSISGSATAGTTVLTTTDLTASGAVPRLGGPPWMGAKPGYKLNTDWLGDDQGIDEAFQGITRRADRVIATAAASCTPAGDTQVRACLRVLELDTSGAIPVKVEDTQLAANGQDTYFGAVGFARDGTALASFDRGGGAVATWSAPGQPLSTATTIVSLDRSQYGVETKHWPSRAVIVADPVDAGMAWSSVPTPETGLAPDIALRGGVSGLPGGTVVAPQWVSLQAELQLFPSTDSPIVTASVAKSMTTHAQDDHEVLSEVIWTGPSRRSVIASVPPGDGPRTLGVQWFTNDWIPSAPVAIPVTVDQTGPTVSVTRTFVVPQTIGSRTKVRWSMTGDDGAGIGVAGFDVWPFQPDSNNTPMFSYTGAAAHLDLATLTGARYTVEVRGKDKLNNVDQEDQYLGSVTRIAQDKSASVHYHGSWSTKSATSASGGTIHTTTASGATVTYSATGIAFGLVVTKGPGRGKLSVSVDGGPAVVIDARKSTTAYRQVVWQATTGYGTHTIRVKALGTSGRPRVDIDAILVLQEASL